MTSHLTSSELYWVTSCLKAEAESETKDTPFHCSLCCCVSACTVHCLKTSRELSAVMGNTMRCDIHQSVFFSVSYFCSLEILCQFWGASSPLCWFNNKEFFVYYTYRRTQLYFTQQYSRNTTTCFSPICGPSSGCYLTYRAAIQHVWGVLLGYWGLGGGNEVSLFQ